MDSIGPKVVPRPNPPLRTHPPPIRAPPTRAGGDGRLLGRARADRDGAGRAEAGDGEAVYAAVARPACPHYGLKPLLLRFTRALLVPMRARSLPCTMPARFNYSFDSQLGMVWLLSMLTSGAPSRRLP
jgi:hypothetical protein